MEGTHQWLQREGGERKSLAALANVLVGQINDALERRMPGAVAMRKWLATVAKAHTPAGRAACLYNQGFGLSQNKCDEIAAAVALARWQLTAGRTHDAEEQAEWLAWLGVGFAIESEKQRAKRDQRAAAKREGKETAKQREKREAKLRKQRATRDGAVMARRERIAALVKQAGNDIPVIVNALTKFTDEQLRVVAEGMARVNEVTWHSPAGVKITHAPTFGETMRITYRDRRGKVLPSMNARSDENFLPDLDALVTGFAPNFIHSMDAALVVYAVREMGRRRFGLGVVHDSFATHAGNVEEMCEILRDTMADVLANTAPGEINRAQEMLQELSPEFRRADPGGPHRELGYERDQRSIYCFD